MSQDKPSRFWYARQYLKAFFKLRNDEKAGPDIRRMSRRAAYAAGFVVAASAVKFMGLAIPFVPLIAGVGVLVCGVGAWLKMRDVRKTLPVRGLIVKAELDRKEGRRPPGLAARFTAAAKKILQRKKAPERNIEKNIEKNVSPQKKIEANAEESSRAKFSEEARKIAEQRAAARRKRNDGPSF